MKRITGNRNIRRLQKTLWLFLALALVVGSMTAVAGAAQTEGSTDEVYVGGMPFGVKFFTEGVVVVGYSDVNTPAGVKNPAREVGIKVRDVIIKINGKAVTGADSLVSLVETSGGEEMTFTVRRPTPKKTGAGQAQELDIKVKPAANEKGEYKSGLIVRDRGAGIGTVTYIIPSGKLFGGLGHGICDSDTGELVPMQRGTVTDVTISGIDRGKSGDPGALKGYFEPGKIGALVGNTVCGVFGVLSKLPDGCDMVSMKVGHRDEVKEGKATVRCTLDGGEIGEYEINISAIDRTQNGSKCFTVTVTDPRLIEKTGGIVQGMSGSPIIQNGKLVGAVTHVMINDPTVGYGIFIDNMLMQMKAR
ncbi:MAG: SpoIVB peptidase [Clostridia bacterium]|nr:SpoIVB peptidase [Clostridia bacterium]